MVIHCLIHIFRTPGGGALSLSITDQSNQKSHQPTLPVRRSSMSSSMRVSGGGLHAIRRLRISREWIDFDWHTGILTAIRECRSDA